MNNSNFDQLYDYIVQCTLAQLVEWCMLRKYLKAEMRCGACGVFMRFVKYARATDVCAFRCMHKLCIHYKRYVCIRAGSFFEKFNLPLVEILKIIIKVLNKQVYANIVRFFDNKKRGTVEKVVNAFYERILRFDMRDKFGGPGFLVEIDETILNKKQKVTAGDPHRTGQMRCVLLNAAMASIKHIRVRFPTNALKPWYQSLSGSSPRALSFGPTSCDPTAGCANFSATAPYATNMSSSTEKQEQTRKQLNLLIAF